MKRKIDLNIKLFLQCLAVLSKTCDPLRTFSIFLSAIETEINTENAGNKPNSSQRGVIMIRLSLRSLATLMSRMSPKVEVSLE